jgi:hypothetical protein
MKEGERFRDEAWRRKRSLQAHMNSDSSSDPLMTTGSLAPTGT